MALSVRAHVVDPTCAATRSVIEQANCAWTFLAARSLIYESNVLVVQKTRDVSSNHAHKVFVMDCHAQMELPLDAMR